MQPQLFARPLFRVDLVCQALDEGGERLVDVADPTSGTRFRMYELEFAIACAMDGTRDLPAIAAWAQVELGFAPAPEEIAEVAARLHQLGYLGRADDELGAAGELPVAAPPRSREVLELGSYTATPTARPGTGADTLRREVSPVELGTPGKSPTFARPDATIPPTGEVELGRPGPAGEAEVAARAGLAIGDASVELGRAGRSDLDTTRPIGKLPAGDLDDLPTVNTSARPEPAVSAGATEPDVSVDLSQQFEVRADDVKEAVRHSRAMQTAPEDYGEDSPMTINSMMATVDVGKDEIGQDEVALAARERLRPTILPAAPGGTSTTAAMAPVKLKERGRSQDESAADSDVERAREKKAAASERAPAEDTLSPPVRRVSARNVALIAVPVLLLALGGIFAFLKFSSDEVGKPPPPRAPRPRATRQPAGGAAPTAAPTPPVSFTLASGEGETSMVTATQAGVVAWVVDKGAIVAAGDPVARLAGFEGAQAELNRSKERLKIYQDQFDQAAAKGDKAGMKAAEADVKRKQRDIERATTKLAALVVTAPVAGVAEPVAAAKARVAAGGELATITTPPPLRATLPPATGAPLAVGAEVALSAPGGSPRLTCKVVEAAATTAMGAVVECPADGGLAPGASVIVAP